MTTAVGRSAGQAFGSCFVALVLLTASPPDRLSAQVSMRLSLGARYASTLVHDSIVTGIDVRPALAPAVAVIAATPLQQG